jgi:hypothetical protein
MNMEQDALAAIKTWWVTRPAIAKNGGLPAQGTLAGALVLLENLQSSYILEISKHLTPGQAQIRGAGKVRTRKILERFGQEV